MSYPKPASSADELPKAYEGAERERFWQAYWAAARIYEFSLRRPDGRLRERSEIFSIDTPPPTVSGSLHIGHVYSYTQTDMTARYQRMRGKHVFYPFGFDDNGLPTERLVEREKGVKAHEFIREHGREAFIALCREVVEKYEAQFVELWQSLALSCDWKQFYTTIGTIRDGEHEDKDLARAISQASFIDLYRKGIVYRRDAPTLWCWADQTAISQAEIEDREVPGHFHFIKFFWAEGPGQPLRGELHIATTRPELIPACVAVMVAADEQGNPSTEQLRTWDGQPLTDYAGNPVRHADLVGKIAVTPLFEVEVPILPSEKVQLDKGTGVLMCCTFGDMEDVEHWQRFRLPTRVIIGRDGRLGESLSSLGGPGWPSRQEAGAKALAEAMLGQKVKAAQAWIRELLGHSGLLLEVKDILHIVRHSERGGVPIEILVTPQWYVNILDHKQALIEQGRRINWQPEYMRKRYEQWVEGLNTDWCISRQRYNGIPFPVWYDEHRQPVLPAAGRLPVNPLADTPEGMTPDPDVMDTWATSSVTPLLNTHLQLGAETEEAQQRHNLLYPFDMRPQAHDIIRTWAFYTIAKAYFHFGEIPWKDIVISGHAQDAARQKMSKSKGNVVTPAELVAKYTADGIRYWSGSCKLGTDTVYDEKTLGEGRKLINKLFNATKFALRHLIGFDPRRHTSKTHWGDPSVALDSVTHPFAGLLHNLKYSTDFWLIDRLVRTIERATKSHEAFDFADAKQAVEDFFWADFCDNYLELSKGRLYGELSALSAHPDRDADALRLSAQTTLYIALSSVLRMFAPALPHITEECWSWYFAQFEPQPSIHVARWPFLHAETVRGERANLPFEEEYEVEVNLLTSALLAVRKAKSEAGVSIKKPVAQLSIYLTEFAPRTQDGSPAFTTAHLAAVLGDLLSTTSSARAELCEGPSPAAAVTTERSPVAVVCEFAPEESAS